MRGIVRRIIQEMIETDGHIAGVGLGGIMSAIAGAEEVRVFPIPFCFSIRASLTSDRSP